MSEQSATFEGWAILELMGHRRLAGYVSEAQVGGATLLRIDVPGGDGQAVATQFYSSSALYCVTPTDEVTARRVAAGSRVAHPLGVAACRGGHRSRVTTQALTPTQRKLMDALVACGEERDRLKREYEEVRAVEQGKWAKYERTHRQAHYQDWRDAMRRRELAHDALIKVLVRYRRLHNQAVEAGLGAGETL